jgi:thymidine kinase
MFSGKSEELIRRLRRSQIAKQKVLVFKNRLDNRYSSTALASHDGNTIDAFAVSTVYEIKAYVENNNANVIGIDEVQFFSNKIVPIICELVNSGKRVIVAGLDLDFRGVPFGCMPLLLAIADKITKLQAICTVCGCDAHFTQRLINGTPANYNDPVIVIGTHEAYQARCRSCHLIDKVPTFNEQDTL